MHECFIYLLTSIYLVEAIKQFELAEPLVLFSLKAFLKKLFKLKNISRNINEFF